MMQPHLTVSIIISKQSLPSLSQYFLQKSSNFKWRMLTALILYILIVRYANSYEQYYNRIVQMESPEIKAILEEEKDSNPIFKVIFNKLKYLRGKLAQIEHIKTLDHKNLKPAQLNKLHKRPQIVQEIQKNEEFVRYYKSILIQHNLSYEKVDDLLKISTLFTVGRRIQTQRYCPKEVRQLYDTFNNSIFGNDDEVSASQLSDEVVRVYHLLWNYLQNQTNYTQCRDYLTYMDEFAQKRREEGQNLPSCNIHYGQKDIQIDNLPINQTLIGEINRKMQKLAIKSQIIQITFDSELIIKANQKSYQKDQQQEDIYNGSQKDIDYKQQCSTTNPSGGSENQDLDCELMNVITHPEIVWIKKGQSYEASDSYSLDKMETCDTNNKPKKKRNRKGKKTISDEIENIRKCSEATAASEKHWGKVRYVEKKNV